MENVTEEKAVLQWHPAFYAGLQIEFAEEAHLLEFENEHQLGTKPKEIDVLVIKKDPKAVIRKNIGKIYRKHNIIEYKSPTDYLSIDDFYKVFGYACFYKADTEKVDEIKVKEITVTYVCKKYPHKVAEHLEKELGLRIERAEDGIHYVHGLWFPMQLVITSRLSPKENLWLSSLTDDLKSGEQTEELLQDYQKHKNEGFYESMMDIIVNANENTFKKEERKMSGALMRIMQDTIDKEVAARVEKEVAEQVEKQVAEQVEKQVAEQVEKQVAEQVVESMVSLVKDGLLSAAEAAKRLSLSEEEILKKLNC